MQQLIVTATRHLRKTDPILKDLIDSIGPCTLFEKNSLLHKPRFHVLIWAIINQQLSVKSAQSIESKLRTSATLNGKRCDVFTVKLIKSLSDNQLAKCGLSRQKIRYIRELCTAIDNQQLSLRTMARKSDLEICEILGQVPGIGPWTIDMFLMFSLGRLDILPIGDLALRKAIHSLYQLPAKTEPEDYYALANSWQPYRTIASWYLWASVD